MAQEGERVKEKEVLQLLIEALKNALQGVAVEAEAFKMAEKSGLDNMQVTLKLFEAKEFLFTAQIQIKDTIDPLLSTLFSDFREGIARDFDLLRNQVNNLCMELIDAEPEQRSSLIEIKEAAKKTASSLVNKLKKELGL